MPMLAPCIGTQWKRNSLHLAQLGDGIITTNSTIIWTRIYKFPIQRNRLIATLKPQSNGPSYSNTAIGTLAVDGWAVTFGRARRGPSSLAPNVTAHPSTASVPTSYYSIWHYTVSHKKLDPFSFEHNLGKYCPILLFFSLLQTETKRDQAYCKIYYQTPNLLLHYLVKWIRMYWPTLLAWFHK